MAIILTRTLAFTLASFLAPALLPAQSPDMQADKVFAMKSLNTGQDLEEMATLFRQVSGASSVTVDADDASVHAWGTLDQMALSQWFQTVLDEPIEGFATRSRSLLHPVAQTDPNDVAIVEYLPAQLTAADIGEIVTTLRKVAKFDRVFGITSRRVIALRGTPSQIETANWIVDQTKQLPGWGAPGPQKLEVRQYQPPDTGPNDTLAILVPAQARDPRSLQEITDALRKEASFDLFFTPRGAIVVRGTPAQIAQAQRIVALHDQPPSPPKRQ